MGRVVIRPFLNSMCKQIHPPMHTAEHILNRTMVEMFGCDRCFSAHIEKKKSKCDYRFDRSLSDKEVADVEKRVNQIIKQDLPVKEEYKSPEEARGLVSLDRLPNSCDAVRIVKVGGYDICACIGPHVASTAEVGGFYIISTGFADSVLRVRFKLGQA